MVTSFHISKFECISKEKKLTKQNIIKEETVFNKKTWRWKRKPSYIYIFFSFYDCKLNKNVVYTDDKDLI